MINSITVPWDIDCPIYEVEDYTNFRGERNIKFYEWKISMITIKKDRSLIVRLSRPDHQRTIEASRINSGEFKYHSRYFDIKYVAEKCYEGLVEQTT